MEEGKAKKVGKREGEWKGGGALMMKANIQNRYTWSESG